jgi:ABC-type microcin C transport system duplicated ATPase subunit YejF
MPNFIFDVHGLEKTFKTVDGVIQAVNGISFGLVEGKTLSVVDEKSGNHPWHPDVIGVKADCNMVSFLGRLN